MGVNIFPIGYSLFRIGRAGLGAGPALCAGAAMPRVRGAGGAPTFNKSYSISETKTAYINTKGITANHKVLHRAL